MATAPASEGINGNFKIPAAGADPVGWVRWSHPPGVAAAEFGVHGFPGTQQVHYVTVARGKESNGWFSQNAISLADIRKALDLKPDAPLEIELRVLAKGENNGNASINLEWQAEPAAGWISKSSTGLPWETFDWQDISLKDAPPERANYFKISLTTYENAGTAMFAKVRVFVNGKPLDAILPAGDSTPRRAPSPSPRSGNTDSPRAPATSRAPNAVDERLNFSFDAAGSGTLPDNWKKWVVGEASTGTAIRDTEVKRTGPAAARIEKTKGMIGLFSDEPIDLHTIRKNLPPGVPVAFEVSGWVKTENSRGGIIAIEWFKNQLGGWHSKVEHSLPGGTRDWTPFQFRATVPTGTRDGEHVTHVRLSLCTIDDPGTLWIDDIEVMVNGHPVADYLIDALLAEEKPSRHARRIVGPNINRPIWTELPSRRVQVDSAPVALQAERVTLAAARGESASRQLVVPATDKADRLAAKASDFLAASGAALPANAIRLGQLLPVHVPAAADGPVRRRGRVFDPIIFPSDQIFVTTPGENAILLLDVTIPRNAPAGVYKGTIEIASNTTGARDVVPVEITVWPFDLPAQPHFKVIGNLWQESVRLFDQRPWLELLPEYARLFREARIRGMSVGLPALVLKGDDVSLDPADAERFLAEIRLLQQHGITEFLSGAGPWVNTGLSYLGALTLPDDATWEPEPGRRIRIMSDEFRRLYVGYHRALGQFLEQHGLLDRLLLYVFDEPYGEGVLPKLREICALIKQGHPGLKTYITITPSALLPQLDVAVPVAQHIPDGDIDPAYRTGGKEVHLYNNWLYFADAQPLCARVTPWMAHKAGITGYLFWSVNFWKTGDVWQNVQIWGDGYLLYPKPGDPAISIRWLNWRDGITDYDYLVMLDERVARLRHRLDLSAADVDAVVAAEHLQHRAKRIVTDMLTCSGASDDFEELRHAIAAAIARLDQIA